jgi:hypothetical protein
MGIVQGWGSLLHIGLGGSNSVYGDRCPAIWFNPNSLSLHISSAINGNKNNTVNLKALHSSEWTTIVIQQQKGQFLIITSKLGSKKIFVAIGFDFNNRDQ